MNQIMLERRQFLQASGALVVGFALAPVAPALAQQATRGAFPLRDVTDDAVDSFLAIAPDGQVTLYSGRVDLGTGLRAAYRQIVAEELDVPYERIVMIDGDTALTPDQGGTGGSTAIVTAGIEVRQAAATARQALLKLASRTPVGSRRAAERDRWCGARGQRPHGHVWRSRRRQALRHQGRCRKRR